MPDLKLVASAQSLIGPDETVSSAFTVIRGPRPGFEVIGLLPLGLAFLLTGSFPFAVLVGVVALAAVVAIRKIRTVALTERNVILFVNRYPHPVSATRLLTRLPRNCAISPPDDAKGYTRILINGESYWLHATSLDEARRMARLTAA